MSTCPSVIKAEVARFTLLDVCGNPIVGPGSAQVVTDSFTEITNTPNYEDGTRFLQRKANGEPCVNEIDAGFLNWIEQTINLCSLDMDLFALVTGAQTIMSGSKFTGAVFTGSLLRAHFSTEVWQPVVGPGACDAEGNQRWMYYAFPHDFDARVQPYTFTNDVFTIGFSSKTKPKGPLWDLGDPWLGDTPAALWEDDAHWAMNETTIPPPEAMCGAFEIGS